MDIKSECDKKGNVKKDVQNDGKKKRSAQFKKEEIKFLTKLVGDRKQILESKTTSRDVKDIAKKARSWEDLATAFNAGCQFTEGRTVSELRKKWENVKTETKKDSAERKKQRLKTGGGKAPEAPVNEIFAMVEDVIKGAMEPITSRYDSNNLGVLKEEEEDCELVEVQDEEEQLVDSLIQQIDNDLEEARTPCVKNPEQPKANASSRSALEETPRPNKRSLEEALEPPNKGRKSNQTKATDGYNRRAEDLHEAKMGLIALKSLQASERHSKFMELMNAQIAMLNKGLINPVNMGSFVQELEDTHDMMNLV